MSVGGAGIPRLQDLSYVEVAMVALLQNATFEEVRRSMVDRARDIERDADTDGSFDEVKWDRVRNDGTQHVHNVVDVLKEAIRIGWLKRPTSGLPSTPASAYLHVDDTYELLPAGRAWAELVLSDRRVAYNDLVGILIDAHPQFEGFLRAVGARPDSPTPALTIPLLRWDGTRHSDEQHFLNDFVAEVNRAVEARALGWSAAPDVIEEGIRSYVGRIRARREARGKTQTRKTYLKTCEEAVTKVAFAGAGIPLDYLSMELLRRWTRFLGLANFTYYAPGPYALRLWGTAMVDGHGTTTSIERRLGPDVREQVLAAVLDVWNERRGLPGAAMYAPVWEVRAAVCWRLRISDVEWDKAIEEHTRGGHPNLGYQLHVDQASLGPAPRSTRPLVLPTSSGHRRVFNVMTVILSSKEKR
jgi:hypothetical protein